jgi:hypothetical protein
MTDEVNAGQAENTIHSSDTVKPMAILAPSAPPPPDINMNFKLTPEQFSAFMRGDPTSVMHMIKETCPKPKTKIYGSWKNVQKKKNKVAIVGFADSRDEAPYKDPEWEIWGLNSLFENIPVIDGKGRFDRWFEIHDRRMYNMDTNKEIGLGLTRDGKPYMEALANLPVPVYMVADYPDMPNCVR